jgi:D-arabinose 1-dehydrogenase-like Zn-dependent alcohol dehydrogenase
MAIQFASKMGCHVTVLSGSDRKKEEAFSKFLAYHPYLRHHDDNSQTRMNYILT